jgi:hypothetical protein
MSTSPISASRERLAQHRDQPYPQKEKKEEEWKEPRFLAEIDRTRAWFLVGTYPHHRNSHGQNWYAIVDVKTLPGGPKAGMRHIIDAMGDRPSLFDRLANCYSDPDDAEARDDLKKFGISGEWVLLIDGLCNDDAEPEKALRIVDVFVFEAEEM